MMSTIGWGEDFTDFGTLTFKPAYSDGNVAVANRSARDRTPATEKHRTHRKIKNAMARKSRRANRK